MYRGRPQGEGSSSAQQGSSSSLPSTGHSDPASASSASASYGRPPNPPHAPHPATLPPVRPLSTAPANQRGDHSHHHFAYNPPSFQSEFASPSSASPTATFGASAPVAYPPWQQRPNSSFPPGSTYSPPDGRSQTPSGISSPTHSPSSRSVGKQRDMEPQPVSRRGSLDMRELSTSYRNIIDAASQPHMASTDPAARRQRSDTLQQMHKAAVSNLRALDPRLAQSLALERRPATADPFSGRRGSGLSEGDKEAGGESSRAERKCMGCDATATPEWRRGPKGPGTLCNACGLVYVKITKQRNAAQSRDGDRSESQVSPTARRRLSKQEDLDP